MSVNRSRSAVAAKFNRLVRVRENVRTMVKQKISEETGGELDERLAPREIPMDWMSSRGIVVV